MILNSKDNEVKGIDPSRQLELLKKKCHLMAPNLYRSYALYLQVLRSILLDSVRNAVLSLITGKGVDNLDLKFFDKSKSCQVAIEKLVCSCNSMLTIEHVMDLADQVEREHKVIIENTKSQLNAVLNPELHSKINYLNSNQKEEDVNLTPYPPIDNPSQINNWFLSNNTNDINEPKAEEVANSSSLQDSHTSEELSDASSSESYSVSSNTNSEKINKTDVMRSLFSIASQVFEGKNYKGISPEEESFSRGEVDVNDIDETELFLPDNPQDLAEWMHSFEDGVCRRLRNLSHSINVELLRSGIVNSIVPLSVLEAVLAGQISSQFSHSNLLRISVPVDPAVLGDGIDIICILVRLSELEFDNPKLRNCRSELNKSQKEIANMLRQYRHWKTRLLTNEIHQNWWKDPKDSSTTNPPIN